MFDSEKRQRYTKAYLLGRYLNPSKNTTYWQHFATELLFPENVIKVAIKQAMLTTTNSKRIIGFIADSLNVSKTALKIRLNQLDLLEN